MDTRNKAVVVGVDFGSSGDAAILMGLEQLATNPDCVMHVMHVIDPREIIDYPEKRALETEAELIANAPKVLAARVRELAMVNGRACPTERVRTHARLGRAVETLLQTCVDYDADLLIVGTHGRKGLDRILLGSVAEALVRSAKCPVLVAREKNYAGAVRTALPDAAYKPGEVPGQYLTTDSPHVTSTQIDGWHPSDAAPTGFRIV